MSVSTYVPSVIDENLYEQTKRDAIATFVSKKSAIISGALAGLLATWLPAIIYFPIVFLYKYQVGAKVFMTGAEKLQSAQDWLMDALGGYVSIGIWLTIALTVYGGFCAVLRRQSALEDKYLKMQFAKWGNMRLGTDAVITIVGIPVLLIIGLFIAQQLNVLIVGLALIVFTGALYYSLWQKLQNFCLRFIHKADFVDTAVMALRLMIPRTIGWKSVRVDNLEVDKSKKSAKVTGEFASKDVENDARNIVQHYLRGYHPVYIVNTKNQG